MASLNKTFTLSSILILFTSLGNAEVPDWGYFGDAPEGWYDRKGPLSDKCVAIEEFTYPLEANGSVYLFATDAIVTVKTHEKNEVILTVKKSGRKGCEKEFDLTTVITETLSPSHRSFKIISHDLWSSLVYCTLVIPASAKSINVISQQRSLYIWDNLTQEVSVETNDGYIMLGKITGPLKINVHGKGSAYVQGCPHIVQAKGAITIKE